MYDLTRLKGVFVAALVVGLALVGCSAVSLALAGGRPGWLAGGDSTIEGGQEKIVGGRIAGVAMQVGSRDRGNLADLGVILGSSAVGMGIDPKLLEAEAGAQLPDHWLSLYANGANLADLHDLAQLLFESSLRPRLLILGIHPGLLARSDDYLTDRLTLDTAAFRQELLAKHAIGAKDELQALSAIPLNWAFPNRTRISNLVRGLTSAAKRRLFARLDVGAEELYRADPDPWQVRLLVADADTPAREVAAEGRTANVRDQAEGPMREGLNGPVKDKGWSDPRAYATDSDNARALVAIIQEARAKGIEIAILILPEAASLRASVPPAAMATLNTVLDQAFGDAAPVVINLRETLADGQFHDSIHPNRSGREATTRKLAAALIARKPAIP